MKLSIKAEFCYALNVIMLNAANKPFMLSVILLSVVAPTSQS
jgi:hypothetical protein